MSPRTRRRLGWLAAAALVAAVAHAQTTTETVVNHDPHHWKFGLPPGGLEYRLRGWPAVWEAAASNFRQDDGGTRSDGWTADHNYAVPVVAVLAAGCLVPAGWSRWARCGLVAGLAGWGFAAAELETGWNAALIPSSRTWLTRVPEYEAGRSAVARLRERADLQLDGGRAFDWRVRAGLTGWAAVCGGGAAVVWWRPWRPAATTGTPA